MDKKIVAVILAVICLAGGMGIYMTQADAKKDQHRLGSSVWTETDLAGAERYATCREANLFFSEMNGIPSSVVMVKGTDFPDALSASSLAGYLGCPVVLYRPNRMAEATKTLLEEDWGRQIKNVYFVGGCAEADIASIRTCVAEDAVIHTEFSGVNRYQTAELVCEYVMQRAGTSACVVVSGVNFPDALSMSAWCYRNKMPLLLVNKNGNISDSTLGYVKCFDTAYIIGGTAVVSAETEQKIGDTANRLCGSNRVETSRTVAQYFTSHSTPTETRNFNKALLVTADNYPDALVGGPLAGTMGSPVLLVNKKGLTDSMKVTLQNNIVNLDHVELYFMGAAAFGEYHQAVMNQLTNT